MTPRESTLGPEKRRPSTAAWLVLFILIYSAAWMSVRPPLDLRSDRGRSAYEAALRVQSHWGDPERRASLPAAARTIAPELAPLSLVASAVWMELDATGPDAAAVPSFLGHVLLIFAAFSAGRRIFGEREGLAAALLALLLPGAWAQTAFEPGPLLTAALGMGLLACALDRGSVAVGAGLWRRSLPAGILTGLSLAADAPVFFIVLVPAVSELVRAARRGDAADFARRFRVLSLAGAVAALTVVLLLPGGQSGLVRPGEGQSLLRQPGAWAGATLFETVQIFGVPLLAVLAGIGLWKRAHWGRRPALEVRDEGLRRGTSGSALEGAAGLAAAVALAPPRAAAMLLASAAILLLAPALVAAASDRRRFPMPLFVPLLVLAGLAAFVGRTASGAGESYAAAQSIVDHLFRTAPGLCATGSPVIRPTDRVSNRIAPYVVLAGRERGIDFRVNASEDGETLPTDFVIAESYLPGERYSVHATERVETSSAVVLFPSRPTLHGEQVRFLYAEFSTLEAAPGDTIEARVHWRVLKDVETGVRFFFHLFTGEVDPIPFDAPFEYRPPGSVTITECRIRIPDDLPPGRYSFGFGLWNQDAGEYLWLRDRIRPRHRPSETLHVVPHAAPSGVGL